MPLFVAKHAHAMVAVLIPNPVMLLTEPNESASLLMLRIERRLEQGAVTLRLIEHLIALGGEPGVLGLERRVAPAPPANQGRTRAGQVLRRTNGLYWSWYRSGLE